MLTGAAVATVTVVATPSPAHAACQYGGTRYSLVEKYLATYDRQYGAVKADGCRTEQERQIVARFQDAMDMHLTGSERGLAGPKTYALTQRLRHIDPKKCYSSVRRIVCIDMTNQMGWMSLSGKILVGPFIVRTGAPWADGSGGPTPPGLFRIGYKSPKQWSRPFRVRMPYWQTVKGDIGLHQSTTWMHSSAPGSHGCINLTPYTAPRLYRATQLGDYVYTFGKKPIRQAWMG